jgi:hypothetical protein
MYQALELLERMPQMDQRMKNIIIEAVEFYKFSIISITYRISHIPFWIRSHKLVSTDILSLWFWARLIKYIF